MATYDALATVGPLFGRQGDIDRLVARAASPGITAVVARPLMGKTATLKASALAIVGQGRSLIGYYESTGFETSHLLYAVADLYARWLTDSSMRAQALSLWERHKGELIPRIGEMVGGLFKALAKTVGVEGVADAVKDAFAGLAVVQKDLQTGGLELSPLPYDQALALASLVATITSRGVVLVLDAWEKSPSRRAEFAALETFLKHVDNWPPTHVFLAVRSPEIDSGRAHEEPLRQARDLCSIGGARAMMLELGPMDLGNAAEASRLVEYIRARIPETSAFSPDQMTSLVDGYPGVLDFWLSRARSPEGVTPQTLQQEATDAQALRYRDLGQLLLGLPEGEPIKLAARIATLERLDASSWPTLRDVVLVEVSNATLDALIDSRVLADEAFPTFGHDTRHFAARCWFTQNRLPLLRRTAESLIQSLASRITGINAGSQPYLEGLAGCATVAADTRVSALAQCLVEAAQSAFATSRSKFTFSTAEGLQQARARGAEFTPLLIGALIKQGFDKSRSRDMRGAIADYTAAIELPGAPIDQLGRALRNRSNARAVVGDKVGSRADLDALISLAGAPTYLVARSLADRAGKSAEDGDFAGAIKDFQAVIELAGISDDQAASARYGLAVLKSVVQEVPPGPA